MNTHLRTKKSSEYKIGYFTMKEISQIRMNVSSNGNDTSIFMILRI